MTQDELRDLIERNHQVQQMTEHPGWPLLADYLRAQMEAKQRWLLIGNAETLEDYKRVAGWLQGVGDVLSAPETLNAQTERAQEEEKNATARSNE